MNRRLIKILIVMWLTIAVGLTSLLMYGIFNNSRSTAFFSFLENPLDSKLTVQKDENVDLKSINKLNLDFSSSNIIVQTTDELNMRVIQKSARKLNDDEKFTVINKDNEVTIKRSNSQRNFTIFNFGNSEEKIELYIPKKYNKDLDIQTSSGNIEFNSDIALGSISCKASSGNLAGVSNITAKDINLKASSGNIDFESLIGSNYKCKASSGNIKINSLSGSGELQTNSGNIKVKYKDITEYSNASVGSGNVDLIIPEGLSFEFSGICSSGDINSSFDLDYKNKKGNEATAKFGSGPYKKIDVKTSSGNISISN